MIDLHLHTCCSDGEHTPKEVVEIAKNCGAEVIAITDHDSVSGLEEAIAAGESNGVRVIPGIEITAFEDAEIHVLGYNIDYRSDKIVEYEDYVKNGRKEETNRTFEYLKSIGINLTEDDVFKFRDGKIITIWHFAMALAEKGYAKDVKEALGSFFERALLDKLSYDRISVKDAIKLIKDVGGIPILAHPGRVSIEADRLIGKIEAWKKVGLLGIEAIYSLNSKEENETFLNLAKELGLAITIGSDYHGEHVKPSIKIGTGVNESMNGYDDVEVKVRKYFCV